MEISIFSSHLVKNIYPTIEEGLSEGCRLGISSMEVFDTELNEWPLAQYKDFALDNGLSISGVIALPHFATDDQILCRSEIFRIMRLIDEIARLGIKQLMVVPDVMPPIRIQDKLAERDQIVKAMKEIAQYGKKANVIITMENYSEHIRPYSTIEEIQYLLANVPDLKFTFDTGNFYCMGIDALQAYEALKEHIVNVHIKDWTGSEFPAYIRPNLPTFDGCAIGSGILPLDEILSALKRDGYDGTLVIEINSDALAMKDVEDSVRFLRSKIEN